MNTATRSFELLLLITALFAGPGRTVLAAEVTPEAEPGKHPESRVSRGTNGEVTITLDAETRRRIGLRLEALAETNQPPIVKGYGHVLDPAPLIALVADLGPAGVAAEASRKEFERLKTLRAQDNASQRALEAAEAQALRDQLLAESLRAKLLLGWGSAIADSDELPGLARALAGVQTVLARVDLPAGERLPGKPTSAQLLPLAANAPPLPAKFLGPAPSTDPQFQGQGFLFLARTNTAPPTTALTAFIQTDGPAVRGIRIPAAAIIRHETKGWAYVQTGDNKFARREVPLTRPVVDGYLVTGGFDPGANVVTTGAQLLLSEELKERSAEE